MDSLLQFAFRLRVALRVLTVAGFRMDFPGCVGGGCFRALATNTSIKDIDVFYNDADLFTEWRRIWDQQNPRHQLTKDPNVNKIWCLSLPGFPTIQFIGFHPFTDETDLAETFDWRCCAMTANLRTGKFYEVPGAYDDCRYRVLVPQVRHTPERMGKRIVKYQEYGFRSCKNFYQILSTCPAYRGGY